MNKEIKQTDNPVQKLAAVECIGWTEGDGCSRSSQCACRGTGKRYWQLWRKCQGCLTWPICERSEDCTCQGTGYLLILEAEWMGILMRIKNDVEKEGKFIPSGSWVRSDDPENDLTEVILRVINK